MICFRRVSEAQVGMPDGSTFTLSEENWPEAVNAFARMAGGEATPYGVLKILGVCPQPLVSPLSLLLWRIYNATDGTKRLRTPAEYLEQPNGWIEACDIIDREVNRKRDVQK